MVYVHELPMVSGLVMSMTCQQGFFLNEIFKLQSMSCFQLQDLAFKIDLLEELFESVIKSLSMKTACLAYVSLTKVYKNVTEGGEYYVCYAGEVRTTDNNIFYYYVRIFQIFLYMFLFMDKIKMKVDFQCIVTCTGVCTVQFMLLVKIGSETLDIEIRNCYLY